MPDIFIQIEHGAIVNKTAFRNRLAELENGHYRVTIEKARKRSLNQNAYYHGIICETVKELLRDAGYNEVKTAADAHEILKYKFLKKQIPNEHGEFVEMLGSTAKLSTTEFNQYMEDIVQWVAESFDYVIPPPGKQTVMSI